MRDAAWRRLRRAAWLVPVPVLLLYGIWIVAFFGPGHDPRDAALIGRHFVEQGHTSSVIRLDPRYGYPAGESGYDGQFVYFIALDPLHARDYVDVPIYRYTRILYPMLARVLALGQPSLIPYTLLLINWLAIGGGTLLAATWLRRKGQSPCFALMYGLYPGLFVALTRDTTEALAYGLVALGVFLFEFGGRRRLVWAAIVFSLAALTRETTVVFPVLYALGMLLIPLPESRDSRARWPAAALLIAIAAGPLLLYKVVLLAWLGSKGDPGLLFEPVPLLGVIRAHTAVDWARQVWSVVVPALLCGAAAVWTLIRRARAVEPVVLLVNVVLFVALLHRSSYADFYSSSRVTTPVVLAAILCIPVLWQVIRTRSWFWISSALWLWPVPFMVLKPELRWLIDLAQRRGL